MIAALLEREAAPCIAVAPCCGCGAASESPLCDDCDDACARAAEHSIECGCDDCRTYVRAIAAGEVTQ